MTKVKRSIRTAVLGTVFMAFLPSCPVADYVDMVDPYISSARGRWFFFGTGKRPFGMVNLFPDTKNAGQAGGGYNWNSTDCVGFCHLHGWMTVGLDVMPTTNGNYQLNKAGWKSSFSRATEVVEPGYHKIYLDKYALQTENTSTERVGLHRWTYTNGGSSDILFSLGGPSGSAIMRNGHIEMVSDTELQGYYDRTDGTWGGPPKIRAFFVARLNKPFTSFETWSNNYNDLSGRVVYSAITAGEVVQMNVAVSFTSIANARNNLNTECNHWDFDAVRTESRRVWNEYFGRIDVRGGTEAQRTKFYTDLWHAMMGRHKLNDVNGDIPDYTDGAGDNTEELKIRKLPLDANGVALHNYYNADSFWLTNFNLNLLWGLGWPHVLRDFAKSFLKLDSIGGFFPRGPNAGGYSYIMTGCPATPLIVSAYNLGTLPDVPVNDILNAVHKNHTTPGEGMAKFYGDLPFYLENGYVPWPHGFAAGLTLEWAYNDWCAAQIAKKAGDLEKHDYFLERAGNYKHTYDPTQQLMWPRNKDGSWAERWDITKWKGFVETNATTNTWYVPHDIPGLVELMGGGDNLTSKLNGFFEIEEPNNFQKGGTTGTYLDYGNQPACGMAHVFNYAGKPWLTQYWARRVNDLAYEGMEPHNGYPGEEDQGQMSGVSAMLKMGLFSLKGAAGIDPVYEITAPVFDTITIHLDARYYSGGTFVITTVNNSKENRYIQSAKLDGAPLDRCWFYQSQLADGGTLELTLGPEPNENWGVSVLPPAMSNPVNRSEEIRKTGGRPSSVIRAGSRFITVDLSGDYEVEFMDPRGRLEVLKKGTGKQQFDFLELKKSGLYLVNVSNAAQTYVKKIMVMP